MGQIPRGFSTGGRRRCYRSWPATQGARRCCRSCASSALRAVRVDGRQAEHGGRGVLLGAPRCAGAHDAGDRLDGAVGVHEQSRSSNAAASSFALLEKEANAARRNGAGVSAKERSRARRCSERSRS